MRSRLLRREHKRLFPSFIDYLNDWKYIDAVTGILYHDLARQTDFNYVNRIKQLSSVSAMWKQATFIADRIYTDFVAELMVNNNKGTMTELSYKEATEWISFARKYTGYIDHPGLRQLETNTVSHVTPYAKGPWSTARCLNYEEDEPNPNNE